MLYVYKVILYVLQCYVMLNVLPGCGDNEEFSNHTLCEHTCENRLTGVPDGCETRWNEGCVCEDGYYRNAEDECVRLKDCEHCLVDGEFKEVYMCAIFG
mgnify:FL=1